MIVCNACCVLSFVVHSARVVGWRSTCTLTSWQWSVYAQRRLRGVSALILSFTGPSCCYALRSQSKHTSAMICRCRCIIGRRSGAALSSTTCIINGHWPTSSHSSPGSTDCLALSVPVSARPGTDHRHWLTGRESGVLRRNQRRCWARQLVRQRSVMMWTAWATMVTTSKSWKWWKSKE